MSFLRLLVGLFYSLELRPKTQKKIQTGFSQHWENLFRIITVNAFVRTSFVRITTFNSHDVRMTTVRASVCYITQLYPMITCGSWFCVENKKKKKEKTKTHSNTKFLLILMDGTKTQASDILKSVNKVKETEKT